MSAEGERATIAAGCGEDRTWVLGHTGAGRGRGLTVGVGCCLDYVQELHVRDVVDVDLDLEDDDERLAGKLDGEDGGGEEELANHRWPLKIEGWVC